MSDIPPNESANLPNELLGTSETSPQVTQGQIQNIVSNNSRVENRRRIRHKEAMLNNTFHLKSGRFSKKLPKYLIDYLTFIDELSFDKPEVSKGVVIRLLKGNLKRIALAEYREQVCQNTLNQQLSKLMRDTFVMAMGIHQTPSLLQRDSESDINLNGLDNDQLNAIDTLVESLRILAEPDYPEPALPS